MLTAVISHGGLLLLRNVFALRRSRLRARSRCGSDSPPDCHSIPHRRYALLRFLAAARSQNGSGVINAIHYHSAATLCFATPKEQRNSLLRQRTPHKAGIKKQVF